MHQYIILSFIIICVIFLFFSLFNFQYFIMETINAVAHGKRLRAVVFFILLPILITLYIGYEKPINQNVLSRYSTTVSLIVGSVLAMLAILSDKKENIIDEDKNNSRRIFDIKKIYEGMRSTIVFEIFIGVILLLSISMYSDMIWIISLIHFLYSIFIQTMLLLICDFYRLNKQ